MPSEFGGKKFAMDFRSMIQDEVAKAVEEGRSHIRGATDELKTAILEQSKGAARMIRAEAQHVRDSFEEYTGNNPPEEAQEVPSASRAPDITPGPENAQATAAPAATPLPAISIDQIIPTEPPRTLPPGMPTGNL